MHGRTEEHLGQLCLQNTPLNAVTLRDTVEEFLTKIRQNVALVALALFSHSQPLRPC